MNQAIGSVRMSPSLIRPVFHGSRGGFGMPDVRRLITTQPPLPGAERLRVEVEGRQKRPNVASIFA